MHRFSPSRIKKVFLDNFYDAEDHLVYVHIGKCGGKSLWKAIEESRAVHARFRHVRQVHIARPPVFERSKYLFVLRNPLSRTVSAFNWRHGIVVGQGSQTVRFPGEKAVLEKYGSLNSFGEALYDGEALNDGAANDFANIHHLREDISFYLEGLLGKLRREQVLAVLVTERLNEDIRTVLGVDRVAKIHEYSSASTGGLVLLSDTALRNLQRFLQPEYECIERLLESYPLDGTARAALLG